MMNSLMEKCNGSYDDVPEYQLLVRAFSEQVFVEEDGSLRLKTAEDGEMNSTILQNPSDPDATYREKAGKQHRGYSANITESVGEGNSVVTDYQYDQNIHSDSDFLKEHLDLTALLTLEKLRAGSNQGFHYSNTVTSRSAARLGNLSFCLRSVFALRND